MKINRCTAVLIPCRVTTTRETAHVFSKVLLNTIADNHIDTSTVFRALSSEGVKQKSYEISA